VSGNLIRGAMIAICVAVAQPAAADVVMLRYGQIPSTVRSVSSLYLFVAQRQGFFAREDLKLEYVPIAGGTDKMVAALDQVPSTLPRPPRPT
jgi:ABC-type nitrate/sulfonate/bicarbonate transport system substrate-binding protein